MSLAVAGVAILLLSAVPAQATTVTATATPPQHWSYSYQWWENRTSGNSSAISYSFQAYYGLQDQITATNTSATTTEMMGVRTVVETLNVTACAPQCRQPSYYLNLTFQGSSTLVQYLNFTTNATVYEPTSTAVTSPAAALGITNASAARAQQLNERSTVTVGGRTSTMTLNETYNSRLLVAFTPPLGLIPWNLSANLTWHSQSAYVASSAWNSSTTATRTVNGNTTTRTGNSSGAVSRAGNESVAGKVYVVGPINTKNNRTIDWVRLRFHGPYNFDNGLFLTAIGSDLFAGATSNWSVGPAPVTGNLSPALTSVFAEHAAPAPTSGPTGTPTTGTPTTGTPTTGTPGGPTTVTGTGPTTVAPPSSTSTPTGPQTPSQGTASPGTPTSQGTAPTQGASTSASPRASGGPAGALGNLGALLLPIGALLVLTGTTAALVVARRRTRGGTRP
jgi:hypothetical protein